MATRLKTVEFCFPDLASLTNNTLTTLTQITVYLPDSPSAFRSCVLRLTCDDIITATGGTITTKTLNLRLAAVAYSSVANANALTHSTENYSLQLCQDYTAYFTTNWTGTSMTCDCQVQLNHSTGTTTNFVNVCTTLQITYEYDDTSATQIKTVYIPLDCPVGAMGTSKPSAIATIPALDTELPEASKTYRAMYVVMQGNINSSNSTTDSTLSAQIDSLAALTTGNHEQALATDRWLRYVWDISGLGMDTSTTHSWYIWGSQARYHHWQAWLVVTYEFDESTTTSAFNSVRIPIKGGSPYMGGTTSSDYLRLLTSLWIEEPTTITTKQIAAYLFWESNSVIAGLNARLGTGSFVTYTDNQGTAAGGGNGLMVRNDSAYTLARGKNDMVVDIYRTDTTDLGGSIGGFLIVNYTSAIASAGIGAHNHTVMWPLMVTGTGAIIGVRTAAVQPLIPETSYWITGLGAEMAAHVDGANTQGGAWLIAHRDSSADGYQSWETLIRYRTITYNGAEIGVRNYLDDCLDVFDQYPSDIRAVKMDLETSRTYEVRFGQSSQGWFHYVGLFFTYHAITFSWSGTISGSSAGTVNIALYDSNGVKVATTSRSGNGSYSMTWYDSVNSVFSEARESATLIGRSDDGTCS